MKNQTETIMPREAMPETEELFNITEKIPPEKMYGFTQFMRGVSYGLDLAAGKQMAAAGGRGERRQAGATSDGRGS